MACCHQATNHYLSQCWTSYVAIWLGHNELMTYCWRHQAITWTLLINHQWGLVAFTWEHFHKKCSWYLSLIWILKSSIWDNSHIAQGPMSYSCDAQFWMSIMALPLGLSSEPKKYHIELLGSSSCIQMFNSLRPSDAYMRRKTDHHRFR